MCGEPNFYTDSRQAGVTLIEMMIVIAIAAILLATAAPSFQTMVIKSNVESLQDDFANAVITARTEAASRGQEVRVCPLKSDGTVTCSEAAWRNGWALVIDDASEAPPIRVLARFPNETGYSVTVHGADGASESAITFNAQGYNANEKRYIFAACGPNDKVVKGVTVEFSGRAYHTSGSSNKHKAKVEGVDTLITLDC